MTIGKGIHNVYNAGRKFSKRKKKEKLKTSDEIAPRKRSP